MATHIELKGVIDDMILDEEIQGNIDIEVWEALHHIKLLSEKYNLSFRKEHVEL